MIRYFSNLLVILVTSTFLAATLFVQDVFSADREPQLEAIPVVFLAYRKSPSTRTRKDRSELLKGTLEYDRIEYFHPEDPAVLFLDCKPVKTLGVWYVLKRTKGLATLRIYAPTFQWSFEDESGEAIVGEHTHSFEFSSHFAGGREEQVRIEYLYLSKSLKRDGFFELVALLEGHELFNARFKLQGCESID